VVVVIVSASGMFGTIVQTLKVDVLAGIVQMIVVADVVVGLLCCSI
jgi:hypothetical protein